MKAPKRTPFDQEAHDVQTALVDKKFREIQAYLRDQLDALGIGYHIIVATEDAGGQFYSKSDTTFAPLPCMVLLGQCGNAIGNIVKKTVQAEEVIMPPEDIKGTRNAPSKIVK